MLNVEFWHCCYNLNWLYWIPLENGFSQMFHNHKLNICYPLWFWELLATIQCPIFYPKWTLPRGRSTQWMTINNFLIHKFDYNICNIPSLSLSFNHEIAHYINKVLIHFMYKWIMWNSTMFKARLFWEKTSCIFK